MSFDLERAKKEGCIYVTRTGIEFDARIICDDRKMVGLPILVLHKMTSGEEQVIAVRGDFQEYNGSGHLKNKPQKLEVRIYKEDGRYGAAVGDEAYRYKGDGIPELVKTIEVEI